MLVFSPPLLLFWLFNMAYINDNDTNCYIGIRELVSISKITFHVDFGIDHHLFQIIHHQMCNPPSPTLWASYMCPHPKLMFLCVIYFGFLMFFYFFTYLYAYMPIYIYFLCLYDNVKFGGDLRGTDPLCFWNHKYYIYIYIFCFFARREKSMNVSNY